MRAILACGMLLAALPGTAAAQQCWYDLGVKQHGNTTALRTELQQLRIENDKLIAMLRAVRDDVSENPRAKHPVVR